MFAETFTRLCKWRQFAPFLSCLCLLGTTAFAQIVNCPGGNCPAVNSVTVCSGNTASLTVTGCSGTLQWSGNGVSSNSNVLTVLTPDAILTQQVLSYSATCTTAGSTSTAVGTITVVPLPFLNINASSLSVTSGQSVTLLTVGCPDGTVTWSNGSVVHNLIVNPTTTTLYSATCSTGPQCEALAVVLITVPGGQLNPALQLSKQVDKTKAQVGEVISYTLTLVNTGTVAVNNIAVYDSANGGVVFVPSSVTPSLGTMIPKLPVSLWYIETLPGNATATVSFAFSVLSEGIIYNTATLPGDTNRVCTSIPIKVCTNEVIDIEMEAPAGYSNYQWYRNGIAIALGTSRSYTATQVGEYTVLVNQGLCPNNSCCPVIIERDTIPLFAVTPKTPTCVSNLPQPDGSLTVLGLGVNPSQYQYAISEGNSFTVNSPVTVAVPANGVLASNLVGDRTYTVRIYNNLGCYRDVTVRITTNCLCLPNICVPAMIKKTKSRITMR